MSTPIPPPGGYELEHAATFGAGTINPCPHKLRVVKAKARDGGTFWRAQHDASGIYARDMDWQPGDAVGTVRCAGCGMRCV